jgi:acetate kinase
VQSISAGRELPHRSPMGSPAAAPPCSASFSKSPNAYNASHAYPESPSNVRIQGIGVLEAASAFAPLHVPSALSVIRFAREHFPGLPQAACFDTTFHAGLQEVANVLPISREFQLEGIRRYGFHGLSCESIMHQLQNDLPKRRVIAHLGNGASVTAVKGGKAIDTSMGLTPTGGVIMGTRSGDLDPGVLIYLMREKKLDAARARRAGRSPFRPPGNFGRRQRLATSA